MFYPSNRAPLETLIGSGKMKKNCRVITCIMNLRLLLKRMANWYIAYCPELPGANGQGKSIEECNREPGRSHYSLLEDRRENAMLGLPEDAIREITARFHEKTSFTAAFTQIWLLPKKRRQLSFSSWINPLNGAIETVPRHTEISDRLARKICKGLGVPDIQNN